MLPALPSNGMIQNFDGLDGLAPCRPSFKKSGCLNKILRKHSGKIKFQIINDNERFNGFICRFQPFLYLQFPVGPVNIRRNTDERQTGVIHQMVNKCDVLGFQALRIQRSITPGGRKDKGQRWFCAQYI